MLIIASEKEIRALPTWASEFLRRAWAPADADGQRKVQTRFDDMRSVNHRIAVQIDQAMNDPDLVQRNFMFSISSNGGQFVQSDFWNSRSHEIAFRLCITWNSRLNLAECATCGNLIQPAKGKKAKFCSAACRVSSYRKTG